MEQKRLSVRTSASNIELKEKSPKKSVFKKETTSHQEFDEYSSQLIVKSPCIPYIPELGERVGVYPAVLLQQIHYWAQKGFAEKKQGKLWVHNKYDAWAQQLRCSLSCIRKTVKKLKQEGLIETKAFRSRYGDTTKWYAINYEALKELGLTLNSETSLSNNVVPTSQKVPLALNENQADPLTKKNPLLKQENIGSTHVSQCNTPLSKISKVINNLSPACAESVYQHMISIWNEVVHQGSKTIKLTESRLKWLKRRFKLEFQGCLEKWKEYCSLIANNDFLMGTGKRGWKATLDWAILPDNIRKVLTDQYQRWEMKSERDKKEQETSTFISSYRPPTEAEIQKKQLEDIAEDVRNRRKKITREAYKNLSKEVIAFYREECEKDFLTRPDPYGEIFRESGWKTPFADIMFEGYVGRILGKELFSQTLEEEIRASTYDKLGLRSDNLGLAIDDLGFIKTAPAHQTAGELHPTAHRNLSQGAADQETQEAERQIQASSHPEFWKGVCKHLLSKLGVGRYKGWISQIRLQNKYHDALVLKATSQKSLVWLKRNFSDSILDCCQKLDPQIRYLEFVCE